MNLSGALALFACANLAAGCADVVTQAMDAGGGTSGAGGEGGIGGMGGTVLTCVDEGQPCGSDIGECVAGVVDCEGTTSLCPGEVGPIEEICDGLDNNCNASTDEGIDCDCANGATQGCGLETGICTIGTQTCTSGVWGNCSGVPPEPAETCDGDDNNCNGAVDESFACVQGSTVDCTTTCGTMGSGSCSSACEVPIGAACNPPVEVCNGIDDDCDGYIDEGLGEISPDTLGGGFGNVAEMEAIGDYFALLARVNGLDSLYKYQSTGAFNGVVAIGDEDLVGPGMVPLDGEDVLLTRGLVSASTVVEARRASFAGANPVLLGNWVAVKDTGLSAFGVGTRPVRTDGSHVAVAFALGTLADSTNPGAVRFVDTPALPANADEQIASNADSAIQMDLVAPFDPDASLIFAYQKDGEIRLVQLDRNDLTSGIDVPVATGAFPHLAASTDDKVALAFKSSTDRLSLVVFNAKTLQCISSPGQSPSSCVTDTGALAVEVTDLVFNGQHWFAGFGTPSGWGLRGLADDGYEVASHTDSSPGATSGVVLASKGDGSVMVASDINSGEFETRIFECN